MTSVEDQDDASHQGNTKLGGGYGYNHDGESDQELQHQRHRNSAIDLFEENAIECTVKPSER